MDATDTALQQLRKAFKENQTVIAVHYACESFSEAKDHPPGVATVAICDLVSGEVLGFNRSDLPAPMSNSEAEDENEREKHVLDSFFQQMARHQDSHVLHWNMSRSEYGFDALRKRWRFLTGEEPANFIAPRHRYDVDSLFEGVFGESYAPHGKLESMAKLNGLDVRSFRQGKDEAELFAVQDWGSLGRSTASKACIIGQLTKKLLEGTAKTAMSVGQVRFAGSRLDAVQVVLELAQKFIYVKRRLRKHPRGKQTISFDHESDDQYLFHSLLAQFFDDIKSEERVGHQTGAGSTMDFFLPTFGIGIELKHTRVGLADKALGEELIVDQERYQKHPGLTHLIIIAFDFDGHVINPRRLESDLQRDHTEPGLTVTVSIVDR